jgi:hypothetical protein
MYTDAPTHVFMRSLARAIARGGTVRRWAERKEVCPEVARGWTELPEFREFVEKWRLEHAERMVGKIGMCVGRAIDRLVELSENRANNSVCVTATKALIEKWIALSVHFVQEQKFQSLGARIDVLLKSRGADKPAATRGRWR